MNEKSEAQIRNEEEVHRIMMERGYDRNSKKHKDAKNKKWYPLAFFIIACFISCGVGAFIAIYNNDKQETAATESEKIIESINTGDIKNENDAYASDDEKSQKINTYKTTDEYTGNIRPSENVSQPDNNTNYPSSENDKTDNHREGFAFDPHHCDTQKEKYNNATNEANKLNEIWENNPEARNDALLAAIQEAYDKANSIYQNEVTPCKKEMYGQK